MRLLLASLAITLCLTPAFAQDGEKKKAPGPPKNLKILPADVNLRQVMGGIARSLGVMCTYCHVQGDFASDDNPKKNIARGMMRMVDDINSRFPDGKRHVGCWTCHRGKTEPEMNPPAPEEPKQ